MAIRTGACRMLTSGALLAIALAFGVWRTSRAFAMLVPTNYSGGRVTFNKTGSGTATVQTGTYKNKTGKPICDFVVGRVPNGGAGTVRGAAVTGGAGFKYDDNGDGNVQDSGSSSDDSNESNSTDDDGTYSDTGRSISDQTCIADDAEFSLAITVNSDNSVDMQWQATGRGTWTGNGGNQMAALVPVNSGSGTQTASIFNPFGIKGIVVLGQNVHPTAGVVSVTFSPPTGVSITTVYHEDHPGVWSAATKTFTFTTPIATSAFFGLNVEIDEFSAGGENTDIGWVANY